MTALPKDSPFSGDPQPEQSDNWIPLGRVIARLKRECEDAIRARDEWSAAEAHAELIQCEREQRAILMVRKYAGK